MTADALLTRVAVALHGVTPPDPQGALALHRDAAARVVAALGDEAGRLRAVHAQYFDMDGKPGFDDTTPEPEDVWRYDRDFRAALTAEPTL